MIRNRVLRRCFRRECFKCKFYRCRRLIGRNRYGEIFNRIIFTVYRGGNGKIRSTQYRIGQQVIQVYFKSIGGGIENTFIGNIQTIGFIHIVIEAAIHFFLPFQNGITVIEIIAVRKKTAAESFRRSL